MIRILRFCAVLLLTGQSVAGQQPRLIAASDIPTVLHEGTQVRIGTRSKRTVTGTTTRVDLNGVAVQTGAQETHVPLGEIDWFRLTVSHFRRQEAFGMQEAIIKKEARLKALWCARLANQMAMLPPFDQVFREIRRVLRQADLP